MRQTEKKPSHKSKHTQNIADITSRGTEDSRAGNRAPLPGNQILQRITPKYGMGLPKWWHKCNGFCKHTRICKAEGHKRATAKHPIVSHVTEAYTQPKHAVQHVSVVLNVSFCPPLAHPCCPQKPLNYNSSQRAITTSSNWQRLQCRNTDQKHLTLQESYHDALQTQTVTTTLLHAKPLFLQTT